MKKVLGILFSLMLGGVFAVSVLAQGEVDPVDPVPLDRTVFVASPRATVVNHPPYPHHHAPSDEAVTDVDPTVPHPHPCKNIGETYNFARNGHKVVVRENQGINFMLFKPEGVWYDATCALMGVYMVLDIWDSDRQRWITIDRDGVRALVEGPRIGHASDIGVSARIPTAGKYDLRIRLWTFSFPGCDRPAVINSRGCGDVSFDRIRIKLRVVKSPSVGDLEWEVIPADEHSEELKSLFAK